MSLRDVERAMTVFEYFYEKNELFAKLVIERAQKEYNEKHAVDSDQEVCSYLHLNTNTYSHV